MDCRSNRRMTCSGLAGFRFFNSQIEGSPGPRVGVKPPPMGAVGGCPAVPGEYLILRPLTGVRQVDVVELP